MPNTPAMIGEGMTVWCGTKGVGEEQLKQAILKSFGSEHYVTDEAFLDIATSVVGTGPAYTYMFLEAQIDTISPRCTCSFSIFFS